MNRRSLLISAGALCLRPLMASAQEGSLVLVAGTKSPLPAIAAHEVRRVYLGVPLVVGDKEVVPLLNLTALETKELFLQKVLFMSAPVYERHMVGRVFRNGGSRIVEFQEAQALVNALTSNPYAISFMSPQDAGKIAALRILGML
jgi:hypothetical protein